MIVWLDAHFSPATATWLSFTFDIQAVHLRELNLHRTEDLAIFDRARLDGAILMSKDRDFVDLQARLGPPPIILWVTCGNTSNLGLTKVLKNAWPEVCALIDKGEVLIEIR